jgi:signal transduction histidine kinase/GAF domain-containing protein
MKADLDYSLSPYNENNDPVTLIQHLLTDIRAAVHADYACVISCAEDLKHVEPISTAAGEQALPAATDAAVFDLLDQTFNQVTPASEARLLPPEALAETPFRSALVFPLALPDEVLGLLGVFALEPDAFKTPLPGGLATQVGLARMVLENIYMYNRMAQNLIVTQSIQLAAKQIADNPSPQHVVNILRDYFFDAHVTSCALLLYGPLREDRPNGPFEYMEVRGTWSKRRGSGVGVGVRFYIDDLPDLLEQLDQEEVLVFPRAKDLSVRLDPLLRIFLQAERVRSLTLLALHANRRKLGIIFVGSDKRHDFTPQELHSYRTVSEFLAINVMTQMLQLQHDRVQQGRAALLDAVTDGVIMVLPGPGGARVLTVNKQFLELFELPSDLNVQDAPLGDLLDRLPFPESQRADLRKMWLAIPVRDPSTQKGEFHRVNDDGQPLDIEWYSVPVYQENQVLGRVYVFHDVTAERTAQRLRSAFLSRISHELRTPLTSIRGFAEFILEATGDQLPDLAREYTEIILSSAKHLNRVFTDMIDMTRADAGEMRLYRNEAYLQDIIIDVVARMELMYKQRRQQVVMDLDDDLPAVSVDIDRMIQVLTNLMTNAIKYSPEGGTIRIGTRFVEKTDQLPPAAPADVILPAIMVSIADNGKGLDKEQAERVFMPFYRTEDAKKNKIEGVGLGLAVTRSIVEMHRGRVWAEPNRKDRDGGLFIFTVPTIERKTELTSKTAD